MKSSEEAVWSEGKDSNSLDLDTKCWPATGGEGLVSFLVKTAHLYQKIEKRTMEGLLKDPALQWVIGLLVHCKFLWHETVFF